MISLRKIIEDNEDENHGFTSDAEYSRAWCQLHGIDPDEYDELAQLAIAELEDKLETAATFFWLGWQARGEREQQVAGV